jgi:hypothetical protein
VAEQAISDSPDHQHARQVLALFSDRCRAVRAGPNPGGTQHPAEGGRIADRGELLGTPEKLAWLGTILRTECVHPN